MRIALIYPYFNKRGGIERYLVELANQLTSKHDVYIFCHEWDEMYAQKYKFIKIPMLKNPSFLSSFVFSIMVQLLLKNWDFDVVHTQGANCFRQDIITAHSCHKAWFVISHKGIRIFSLRWWLKVLNPLHYLTILTETIQYRKGNFKKIIAISHTVKKELIQYYNIPPDAITVIHNGVDCDEFHPGNKEKFAITIRDNYGLRKSDIVVLFVANEFRRKGLEPLVRALASLRDHRVKLLVVGRDCDNRFKQLADHLDVSQQIIFVGPSSKIAQCYAASDMFIFPSSYEPFGLVILEAMASGLPVVFSKGAGAAELIEDGMDGLLIKDVSDIEEIVGYMRGLTVVENRWRMGQLARYKAEQYAWEKVCEKIMQVYDCLRLIPS
jgi:UDP-glucose:(heptosyl)LPS alpha-1,3-glucosyltransferase